MYVRRCTDPRYQRDSHLAFDGKAARGCDATSPLPNSKNTPTKLAAMMEQQDILPDPVGILYGLVITRSTIKCCPVRQQQHLFWVPSSQCTNSQSFESWPRFNCSPD